MYRSSYFQFDPLWRYYIMKETTSEFQDLLDFFAEIEQDTSLLTPTRSVSSESEVNALPNSAPPVAVISTTETSPRRVTPAGTTSAPTPPHSPAQFAAPAATPQQPTTRATTPLEHHTSRVMSAPQAFARPASLSSSSAATANTTEEMDLEDIFADVHQLLDQLIPQDAETPTLATSPTTPIATLSSSTPNLRNSSTSDSTTSVVTLALHEQCTHSSTTSTTPAGVECETYATSSTNISCYGTANDFPLASSQETLYTHELPLSYADLIPDSQDDLKQSFAPVHSVQFTSHPPKATSQDTTAKLHNPQTKQANPTISKHLDLDYATTNLQSLLRHEIEVQPMGLASSAQLSTLLEVLSQAKSPLDDHIDYHHLATQDWEKIRATYTLNEAEIADLEATSSSGSFDYDGELNSKFQLIMANNESLINQAFADELSNVTEEQLLLQAQQEHYSSSNKLLAQTSNASSHSPSLQISDSALSGKIVNTEQLEVPRATLASQVQASISGTATHLTPNGNSLTIHHIPITTPATTPATGDTGEVVWHVDLFRHEPNQPSETASVTSTNTLREQSENQHRNPKGQVVQPARLSQAQQESFPDFNQFAEKLFEENQFLSNQITTQNHQITGIAELLGENTPPAISKPQQGTRNNTNTGKSSAPSTNSATSTAQIAEEAYANLPVTPAELEQARKQQAHDNLQAASILSRLGFNIQTPDAQVTDVASEAAPPEPASQAIAQKATSSTNSSSSTTKSSKKSPAHTQTIIHDSEGHEFYSQYTYEADELNQSEELPVLECDATLPNTLLGVQSPAALPTEVQPLENFGVCLRFEIDYRQYIDAFKSPENEPVITRVLQRLQLPMPACLLLTGAEGASLERKVTRALYDYIVQARKHNDGSYLSKATTFYMDLERLIQSSKPLSFFTSHPEEADIVIINNIQLCLNSDLWQARLVEIINYCMSHKRILILTSALSKSELTEKLYGLNIMQDLNSRLQFFINLKFERLTGKYLTNYLHGRCVNQGTPLPSSTINYLAKIIQVDRSVDIDMTAFRIFKFGVLRNFDTNNLSKYIIMKNEKALIGRHLLTNKYVTNQDLSIALFRRLEKLRYFDDRAEMYGEVWQELRQQYLAELDLDDDAQVTV